MEITYLGHSSFKLRGKSATVITDPFDGTMVGFPYPKHTAGDILLVSHDHKDHNNVGAVEGSPFVVSGPGEYDIKGVSVIGIPSFHDSKKGNDRGDNTMYHIEMDGINIAFLGDQGSIPTTQEYEKLDGVDILILPVGGDVTITPKEANDIIAEVEPAIVIPMHYKTAKHNPKVFGTLSDLPTFLKAIDKEGISPVSKFSTTKDKLPTETYVVIFE